MKCKALSKKSITAIIAMVFVASTFIGCDGKSSSESTKKNTIKIVDMTHRNVKVPADIKSVLSISPPATMLTYMLAPDKLMGWNLKMTGKYIPDKYKKLPVVGGWYGTTKGNYEKYMSLKPDLIIDEGHNAVQADAVKKDTEEDQKNLGNIPVVGVTDTVTLANFPNYIRFVGKMLNESQQAEKLVAFYNKVINQAKSVAATIPDNQKVKVYYAEGSNGLQTAPAKSIHTQPIDICGGINVAQVALDKMGMVDVSPEQVLNWNPDVIIATDANFYKGIYSNPVWKGIKAVKNHKVYLVPSDPFNWYDRSPSVNIILGVPWTAKILYPDKFQNMDLNSLIKEFYTDFYHYNLTDSDVNKLLNTKQ
ncbi:MULTISPECIES: iron ABC transporter substrate-binding protein [Clostridium]|uniref:Predicted ABC transporter n=3 Tax=Clostridium TaxID=1485 RepID=D8GUB2_CLOLD|nr:MULTISPECIES: iron ABC transporter substrate-binding protein [Clostridium]ADK14775.1 predicted ABC transporter [Clostridium ljungdahlii DSM 13528]AGY78025.1 iron ABC transporter substrate-binding protein [Clostridium autoethanogenum DSM 10061]ALU38159.1 ABC-type transporter periplasmic subunit [Clostridium autoethanogenum DSM 10061]OAA85975.1 Vitamin B12-binding protein precursor [Clostridium ljungdahlii DSM 13528]OVY50923.1 Vitamin B12-binding protein precursor [Clostridium autoethanogenum